MVIASLNTDLLHVNLDCTGLQYYFKRTALHDNIAIIYRMILKVCVK